MSVCTLQSVRNAEMFELFRTKWQVMLVSMILYCPGSAKHQECMIMVRLKENFLQQSRPISAFFLKL